MTATPDVRFMEAAGFVQRTGITYRQLDHWSTRGVLRSCTQDVGCGRYRLFDIDEVRIGRAMKAASAVGASLDILRRAAEEMRCNPAADWVRLSEPVAAVALPRPDGGLYLSVAEVQS